MTTPPHTCPTCHQPVALTALRDVVALRLLLHWCQDTTDTTLTPELVAAHEAIPTGALITLDGARCRVLGPDLIAAVIDAFERYPRLAEGIWQSNTHAAPQVVAHLLDTDNPFHVAFPNDGFGSFGLTGGVDVYILSIDTARDLLASHGYALSDPYRRLDWSTAWAFSSADDTDVDKP